MVARVHIVYLALVSLSLAACFGGGKDNTAGESLTSIGDLLSLEEDTGLTILSLEPSSGASGDTVTIATSGFEGNQKELRVFFNEVQGLILSIKENEIIAKVPAQLSEEFTNPATVSTSRNGKVKSLENAFEYTSNATCGDASPIIGSVMPQKISSDDLLIVKGSGFANDQLFTIGLKEAEVLTIDESAVSLAVPNLDLDCNEITGCLFDVGVATGDGCTSIKQNAALYEFIDSDGDGVSDKSDCAPADPNRYPGAPDSFGNGNDFNCEADQPSCVGSPTVPACDDFDMALDMGFEGSLESRYCIKTEFVPDPSLDPFGPEAKYRLTIERQKGSGVPDPQAIIINSFLYEFSAVSDFDSNCGPKGPPFNPFSGSETIEADFGSDLTVCDFFGTNGLSDQHNFVVVETDPDIPLKHTLRVRHTFFPALGEVETVEISCEFGD